ncbi:unnamed protein product [Onchocerca flexuosa]|uniref:UBC core domain-containing protein n=1 Tax=Onchocerca flexuosa TaxID=387005 RepID=A0A183HCJ0_9BILA|nr:unnamed protein product [Onchocerca flexuosa]
MFAFDGWPPFMYVMHSSVSVSVCVYVRVCLYVCVCVYVYRYGSLVTGLYIPDGITYPPYCKRMNFREFVDDFRKDIVNGWRILADKSEMKFNWPVNCPIEVRELVGPERFDPQDPRFMMPFFWKKEPVPACRSWYNLHHFRS